jgi:SAM-dependent methyltransferase
VQSDEDPSKRRQGSFRECRVPELHDAAASRRDLGRVSADVLANLYYLNSHYDIRNDNYSISSHRPLVGRALVKGRELVHGEIKRYLDPVITRQVELNKRLATVLDGLAEVAAESSLRISELNRAVNSGGGEIEGPLSCSSPLSEACSQGEPDTQVEHDLPLGRARALLGANNSQRYLAFEDRFRGSRGDITARQSAFVHLFEGCRNVLDIGCGRGEFLELLLEGGIGAYGVDANQEMIDLCRSRGLCVFEMDALSYLDDVEAESLDGIFMSQVVEHLEPDYFLELLRSCHSKLAKQSHIVVETVNPLSLFSFMNFYIDPSHKRPVHPETLKYLLESVGFKEVGLIFSGPLPDDAKLSVIDLVDELTDAEKEIARIHNRNVGALNNLLFGPQDYTAVGQRR